MQQFKQDSDPYLSLAIKIIELLQYSNDIGFIEYKIAIEVLHPVLSDLKAEIKFRTPENWFKLVDKDEDKYICTQEFSDYLKKTDIQTLKQKHWTQLEANSAKYKATQRMPLTSPQLARAKSCKYKLEHNIESTPMGPPIIQFTPDDNQQEPHDEQIFNEDSFYKFTQELGRGTQGIVYLYVSLKNSYQKMAVKAARQNNKLSSLAVQIESNFHQSMSKIIGLKKYLPEYYGNCYMGPKDNSIQGIKTEYIHLSIQEYVLKQDIQNKLSPKDLCIQMFDAIAALHSEAKLLHRDIKLDNFRIQGNQIKVINYGLMKEYIVNGAHIQANSVQGFLGTPLTASIAAMEEKMQSRRDDLESLGYNFMFFINQNEVPWANGKSIKEIKDKKIEFVNQMTQRLPLEFQSIQKFIRLARSLKFEENPEYYKFRSIIREFIDLQNLKKSQLIESELKIKYVNSIKQNFIKSLIEQECKIQNIQKPQGNKLHQDQDCQEIADERIDGMNFQSQKSRQAEFTKNPITKINENIIAYPDTDHQQSNKQFDSKNINEQNKILTSQQAINHKMLDINVFPFLKSQIVKNLEKDQMRTLEQLSIVKTTKEISELDSHLIKAQTDLNQFIILIQYLEKVRLNKTDNSIPTRLNSFIIKYNQKIQSLKLVINIISQRKKGNQVDSYNKELQDCPQELENLKQMNEQIEDIIWNEYKSVLPLAGDIKCEEFTDQTMLTFYHLKVRSIDKICVLKEINSKYDKKKELGERLFDIGKKMSKLGSNYSTLELKYNQLVKQEKLKQDKINELTQIINQYQQQQVPNQQQSVFAQNTNNQGSFLVESQQTNNIQDQKHNQRQDKPKRKNNLSKAVKASEIKQSFLSETSFYLKAQSIIYLKKWLKDVYGKEVQSKLLYKATPNDILAANTFHQFCDNQGPLLVLILTSKDIQCGGFCNVSWRSSGEWVSDDNSFIFSLNTNKQYRQNMSCTQTLFFNEHYGPNFGNHTIGLDHNNKLLSIINIQPFNIPQNDQGNHEITEEMHESRTEIKQLEVFSIFPIK